MRSLAVVLIACLLASCGGGGQGVPEASRASSAIPRFGDADPHDWDGIRPWQYPVHGIDVSKYQGNVDWSQVRASGVSFAFIKATEGGDHADDLFMQNWEGARAAGVARGAYHYFYFCRPAAEQVSWFIAHVPRDPSALPPVVDLEWTHKSKTCPWAERPDPVTVRREALLFLQSMAAYYGKRPIIYTTVDFYRDNDLGRIPGFHFWLRSVAGHPQDVYPGQRWAFWQYTGTGLVEGVDGLTDINVFGGTRAQWAGFANG